MTRFLAVILLFLAFPCRADVVDNSANQPSFPPGGQSLLSTVNPSASRKNITVQNQSADTVQVWRDRDCAGTQLSLIVLAPGASAGKQGSAWSSDSFKNCIRVYAPSSGDQVAIYQN